MGRPVLLYAVCVTLPCALLLAAWGSVTSGDTRTATLLFTAAARGTTKQGLQLPAGTAQGTPLLHMPG
jgi:hypothetical protein